MANSPYHRILNGEQVLYFLHVPRTGGTSTRSLISSYFHRDHICPWQTRDSCDSDAPEPWQGFQFYGGHLGHDFYRVIGRRPLVITLLRDPIESAVSAFCDAERLGAIEPGISLAEFARSAHGGSMATRFRQALLDDAAQQLRDLPPEETVAMAMANLDNMLFVGVTEQLDLSMQVLAHTMGWAGPLAMPRRNRSRLPHAAIDPAGAAAVMERVEVERPIYQRALQLLAERRDRMTRDLLDGEHRARLREAPRRTHVELDLDDAMPGVGWQGHEAVPPPSPMRWTGPGTEATIDLPLAQDRSLSLLAIVGQPFEPALLDSLEVLVNDHPVPVHLRELAPGRCLLGALMPREVLRLDPDLTRIRFRWSRSCQLRDAAARRVDDRRLGILFEMLSIAPQVVPVSCDAAATAMSLRPAMSPA